MKDLGNERNEMEDWEEEIIICFGFKCTEIKQFDS
jgi:hypothetical protein